MDCDLMVLVLFAEDLKVLLSFRRFLVLGVFKVLKVLCLSVSYRNHHYLGCIQALNKFLLYKVFTCTSNALDFKHASQ